MTSRENILSRAKANKPDLLELPVINVEVFADGKDLLEEFTKKVEVVGGNVVEQNVSETIFSQVSKMYPDAKVNYATLEGAGDFNTVSLEALKKPHELENLDVLILESILGVAENGAVWLSDGQLPIRVLPFITNHLVIVLKKENIVPFLHQAYPILAKKDNDFGVFISGPSKTADIEQSLVIGAHGAMTLTVVLK
ncbi:LutC/YkgG family protein [Flavicella sediminum]|uniref:LutC/YkgG family protein n=1 Tax=Flavicella sediminum TaxID=2585141 RepID=UPI00140C34CE|nr:LUD domain-containing protein [Flavicella sediminum]